MESSRDGAPCPPNSIFRLPIGGTVLRYVKIVDSSGQIGRFLPAMAPIAPCLPPNPHRPRAFGGKGAEGMKKGIPAMGLVKWGSGSFRQG
jgi:hypothetical protein